MEISIRRGIWHTDCEKNPWKSGVCKELEDDKKNGTTLIECLHCGQKGRIPHGTPFGVKVCIEGV
jgi:hypothetical protein